jgi:single-stranded-DNA-specific exonuclease
LQNLEAPTEFLTELYARSQEFLREDRYRNIADADEFFTKVVGVTFEGRQAIVGGLREGDVLELIREPENPYDPCAIAVRFGALGLGYLRRDIAQHLAPEIDAGRRYTVKIASLTGGGARSLGVNIVLRRVDRERELHAQVSLMPGALSFTDLQRALIGDRVLREGQRAVIERVLSGKRTLAVLGTGRGKSLCFQLPAALLASERGQKTLVMYPLRALANDQFEALRQRLAPCGLRVLRANGAIDAAEREVLMNAFETGAWDILLTTPEFVQFHGDRFMNDLNRPSFVVVDEAHHVHEAKHRPAYRGIAGFLERLGQPTVLALTATAKQECFDDLVRTLGIEAWIIDPTVRENLTVVDSRGTKDRLAYLRNIFADGGKGIIYCNSRNEATKVAELLRASYPATAFYHAGVATPLRLEVESRFRSGEIRIVVATSAFGEGIDLPDVRDVVLYHLNFSFTEFNQQAGRAGRDGEAARIHLLYGEPDRRINDFIISKSAPTIPILREIYRGVKGLADENGELRMPWTEIARTLEFDRADETTIATAVRIFADAGLAEIRQDDDGRVIRFFANPPKVDIATTPRYAEGEAERESFNRFCNVAMQAAAVDLERIINRPIYPSSVPLVR